MFRKLECRLFGHRLQVWQELTPWSRRVICLHCKGDWEMNDDLGWIRWGADSEKLHRAFGIALLPRYYRSNR